MDWSLKKLRSLLSGIVTLWLLFYFPPSHSQLLNFAQWQQQLELRFTTAAQSIFNKNCSGVVTVQATRSGVAYSVPSTLTVDLSGPANLTFYSDVGCTLAITSVAIASGSSSANFYFVDLANAAPTITATAASYRPATQTQSVATNGFVWTGAVSSAWSTGGNWSGGVVPTSTSRVVFDSSCSTNCSPVISSDVTVTAIRMASSYTGTLAQGAFNMTISSGGFVQMAGTFSGTSDPTKVVTLTNDGAATISGGTFTAPVSTFSVMGAWSIFNSPTVTFPMGSTLRLYCTGSGPCYIGSVAHTPSTVTYQNVVFSGRRTTYNLGGATMTVAGNLTLGETSLQRGIDNGTINLGGNLSTATALGNMGTALIVLTGNPAGQTISDSFGGEFPAIEVAAGTNPVTLSGTVKTRKFTLTSVGTFTATGSTLQLYCQSGWSGCSNTTSNLTLGSVTYNNLTFNGYSTNWNFGGATVTVAGNLSFGDRDTSPGGERLSNGTLNVSGNITATDQGYYGSAIVVATGNVAGQTITGVSGRGFPHLRIDAGANPVTLAGTIRTADYNYVSSGTFTTTGSTVHLYCANGIALSCESTTKAVSFGSVTYNNLTINGYSTNWNFGGGTFTVAGSLSFGDIDSSPSNERLSNGTINATGNITATDYGYYGSAIVVAAGNPSGQTITGVSGRGFPHLRIDAGANPVTLAGTIRTPDYNYVSSGTFTTTGSTVHLFCNIGIALSCENTSKAVALGSVTYNNLTINGYSTAWNFGGGTVTVAGNLSFGDLDTSPNNYRIDNATLNVAGNITQTNEGYDATNATIVATGRPAGQTITGVSPKRSPPMQINTGANPVTLSGTLRVAQWTVTSVGAFTSTGSTLYIRCNSGMVICSGVTVALAPGSVNYNNVTIEGNNTTWDLGGATFKVDGNLILNDLTGSANRRIQNGTLEVGGDVSLNANGVLGDAALRFVGSGPQTMSAGSSSMPSGTITVNKPSGTLTFLSNVLWNKAGQSMTITNGTVDMAGFNLTVNNVLTIGTGTTLTRNLGTLTYGSLVNNGTLNP